MSPDAKTPATDRENFILHGCLAYKRNLSPVEQVTRIVDAILGFLASQQPVAATGDDVISEIAAERRRQVEAEGWTPEHDDEHRHGEMAVAAACYVMGDRALGWPWSKEWWKPKDPRRDLIRAAALIVAEIQRLDRAALRRPQPSTWRPDKWLIWSNEHRAWWGPDSSGYRGIISHAGRYSFEKASAICKDGGRQRAWSENQGPFEVMVLAPECLPAALRGGTAND